MFYERRRVGRPVRRLSYAFLALLLAAPAAAADQAPSERPRIEADGHPWQAFGRVNHQGSGFCTGVLVGPTIVLTAAHCLYNRRAGAWAEAERIHFVAAYDNHGYAFHARAARYRVAQGYDPAKTMRNPAEAARDWAVVTLVRPAPARLGYLGVARVVKETGVPGALEFSLAGYGRDRPYALSAHQGCRLVGWDADFVLLLHDCQAVGGISGAPILGSRDGHFLVFALHVGRGQADGERLGGAVPGGAFFEAVREATGREVRRSQLLDFLPDLGAE